jgi:predicted ATPase
LLRIQRRIAEKQLNKDDVAVYYFDPQEIETKIIKIIIDDNGQLTQFPKGFFEEGLEDSFKIAMVNGD